MMESKIDCIARVLPTYSELKSLPLRHTPEHSRFVEDSHPESFSTASERTQRDPTKDQAYVQCGKGLPAGG